MDGWTIELQAATHIPFPLSTAQLSLFLTLNIRAEHRQYFNLFRCRIQYCRFLEFSLSVCYINNAVAYLCEVYFNLLLFHCHSYSFGVEFAVDILTCCIIFVPLQSESCLFHKMKYVEVKMSVVTKKKIHSLELGWYFIMSLYFHKGSLDEHVLLFVVNGLEKQDC